MQEGASTPYAPPFKDGLAPRESIQKNSINENDRTDVAVPGKTSFLVPHKTKIGYIVYLFSEKENILFYGILLVFLLKNILIKQRSTRKTFHRDK